MIMNLDKVIDRLHNRKQEIAGFFREVAEKQLTHDEYLDRYNKRFPASAFEGLPRWAVSELEGYRDGRYEPLMEYHTEQRDELDGRQYNRTTGEAALDRETSFMGRWQDVRFIGWWYRGTDKCFLSAK
jgi:hypothetical protein